MSRQSFSQLELTADEAEQLVASLGDERLLTKDHAAKFLSVSPRTVDAWCANVRGSRKRKTTRSGRKAIRPSRERLPYIKLGHKVFFMLGDLRRFRDERKVAA